MHIKLTFQLFFTGFLALVTHSAICQQKTIEITKYNKRTVPPGKEWVISNSKSYKIIFSDGVFESGTSCNASFHSTPSFIFGICYKEPTASRQEIGFTFKDVSRFDNEVYLIQPRIFLHSIYAIQYLEKTEFKSEELVFKAGSEVWTYGLYCEHYD